MSKLGSVVAEYFGQPKLSSRDVALLKTIDEHRSEFIVSGSGTLSINFDDDEATKRVIERIKELKSLALVSEPNS